MKPVLVFDMNETLLDMSALDPTFAGNFGRAQGAELRKTWFKLVLELKPGDILLVAAHAWDIAGAIAAGCEAAFIARPEKVWSPSGPEPKYQAADLTMLAERVCADLT